MVVGITPCLRWKLEVLWGDKAEATWGRHGVIAVGDSKELNISHWEV